MPKFDCLGWDRGLARAKAMVDQWVPGDKGDQLSRMRRQITEACSGPETSESLAFAQMLVMSARKGRA